MLRRMLALIAPLLAGSALAFAVRPWITSAPPQVPATVVDDPSLSRLESDGVQLHGRVTGASSTPFVVVLHGGPGGDHRSRPGLEG